MAPIAAFISPIPNPILVGDIAAPGNAMLVGLMVLPLPGLDIGNPGGAGIPGGGPFAVVKGWMPPPFLPGKGPVGESGVSGPPIPPGCPERTPSGFFENERRMPPRCALLCNGYP